MKVVLQRVQNASLEIDGEKTAEISKGYLLLVGIQDADTAEDISYLVRKIANLRIFEDENDKMNLSIKDVDGEILSVSQFTLYADTKKGNRPSFTKAGKPEFAEQMYLKFNEELRKEDIPVSEGVFGADMHISLLNDGPVTIIFDTENK